MFEKYGEFDSAEELNRAAAAQFAEGDEEAIMAIALENGIDKEDAEDYMDGVLGELATVLTAAVGKLDVEEKKLCLEGIVKDWKDAVVELCMTDHHMAVAVRRKGKSLTECMASLIKFSFENKVQVSDEIVDATMITHNGKLQKMRKPLYLGVPNKSEVKRLIKEYYMS